jgi:serine/threonine-protein kinase
MIGRTVGSYTLVEKLGQGGMGEVYLAEHRRIGRRAAIKFLLPSLTQDADVVTRFFNEARATSLIKHPGIVEIYDCDVIDEKAYIVMEYLEGESLAAALRRAGPLAADPIAIAAVVGQIASALGAAHRKEIIHRDLKPENVFLALEDAARGPFTVKILDFGIAKLAAPGGGGSHTRTGGLLGTPIYMSPEQCRGVSTIDRRADIYSLGCVMFELATGRHVFVKDAAGDLLVAHIIESPPRVSAFRPEIPGWMDDLVARMLSKSPDDRPSSMDEIVAAMESFLQVGAAAFATRIPSTSALAHIPAPRKRATAPVMASQGASAGVSQGAAPELSAGVARPAASGLAARPTARPTDERSAPARTPSVPAIGGTRILPDGGPPADKPTNESTFRRSAAELMSEPTLGDLAPPKRKLPLLPLAAGGLAVAGIAAYFLTQGHLTSHPRPVVAQPEPAAPALPPAPPAVAPAPSDEPPKPAAPPAKVTIRVVSRPAGAELWLADEASPRGATPLDLVLRKDASQVHGVLKADGFQNAAVVIDPARTGPLEVALEKAKAAPPAHHHASGGSGHHAAHEAEPPTTATKPATPKKPEGFFGVGD